MSFTARLFLYGMAIPGFVGLAAMAGVVLPGDGDDLSLPRLLAGGFTMMAIQIGGGFVGGRIAGRHA
ncbi:hypothetical protein ACFQ0X_44125 [Streptomyces rectiviolaceus]|uniref:MFS transporter n=1 Tax=Streptomyces rectiviolaceus TaxID=332591 RepID=A0ABP6NQ35_9ACTN